MRKFNVTVNNISYEVSVEEVGNEENQVYAPIQTQVVKPQIAKVAKPQVKVAVPANGTKLTAPMPGNILKINVSNGASVKKNEVIFVLEAMKMENDVVAPCDGIISISVSQGATVASGDILAVIA